MPGHRSHGEVDRRVRLMFQRVLASWAGDALELRRIGLDRPTQRPLRPGTAASGPRTHVSLITQPASLRRAA